LTVLVLCGALAGMLAGCTSASQTPGTDEREILAGVLENRALAGTRAVVL
jgi:hypothetical protein